MARRRWKEWPHRIEKELKSSSGAVGLAGLVISATGAAISTPIIVSVGVGLASLALAVSIYKATPPQTVNAVDRVGTLITDLNELNYIHPRLVRVGFVGTSKVGKSTLLDHLRAAPVRNERTERPYATVISLQTTPPKYCALIDAAGQEYSQQFKIIDNCDIVFFISDHNASDKNIQIDNDRLKEHDKFIQQADAHMHYANVQPKEIHLIMNKEDLWGKQGSRILQNWSSTHIANWRRSISSPVKVLEHSNMRAEAVTKIYEFLRPRV